MSHEGSSKAFDKFQEKCDGSGVSDSSLPRVSIFFKLEHVSLSPNRGQRHYLRLHRQRQPQIEDFSSLSAVETGLRHADNRDCAMCRADPIQPTTLSDIATRLPIPAASWRASGVVRSLRLRESARARIEKFVVPPLGGILPSRNDLFSWTPSPL